MIAYECASYALRGFVIGFVLAALASLGLYQAMALSYSTYEFQLPWAQVGVSIVVVLAVIGVSVAYALRRAGAGSVSRPCAPTRCSAGRPRARGDSRARGPYRPPGTNTRLPTESRPKASEAAYCQQAIRDFRRNHGQRRRKSRIAHNREERGPRTHARGPRGRM